MDGLWLSVISFAVAMALVLSWIAWDTRRQRRSRARELERTRRILALWEKREREL